MLVVAEREQLPVPQARAGSPEAWDVLFKRYQLPLYVYVFELVHDEQAALDLVQETFINAAHYLGSLREEIDESASGFEEAPDGLLIRQEQEAEVMELLNKLPVPQRSVLLLHFIEEFSLEEIAGITEASLGTVKSRMHYAKKALRKLIEEKL